MSKINWRKASMNWRAILATAPLAILVCTLSPLSVSAQEQGEKTFASPKDAAQAL